jgi:hypothetical protein
MKIYIVTQCCDNEYGCTENIGVFATREEAEQHLQKNADMYIEEWEVGGNQIS